MIPFRFIFIVFLFALVVAGVSYKTYSFYQDASASTNNTFSAASVFPTQPISGTPSQTPDSSTPTPTDMLTPSPTPSNIANHLVISEVQTTGGIGLTDHDFIEIYNPTNVNQDLNGLQLVKRTNGSASEVSIKSWTSSTIIQPHKYYLWVSSADSSFPTTIGADTSTTPTISDNNGIALQQNVSPNTIIDSLAWGTGSSAFIEGTIFTPNPTANQSVERKAFSTSTQTSMMTGADVSQGNGYDTNINSNDFILRTTSQPQNSTSTPEP